MPLASTHRTRVLVALVAVAVGACSTLWAGAAEAQQAPSSAPTLPSETLKANAATKGTTDVAKGGFVGTDRPKEEDPREVTDLSLAAGGLFTAGNSRTIALTSGAKLRLRRDQHQFSAALAANVARAGKRDQPSETTVENYQGLLRYDLFLSDSVSVFLQSTARHDRFQGLDLRYNLDPGVAYYFFDTKKHRLQGELGYDLQLDVRRDASRAQSVPAGSPAGTPAPPLLDKARTLNNVRSFLGYENKLRKEVSFVASFEYLQSFEDYETFRMVGDIGLKSNVADSLALATTYTIRYENLPLPNVEKADSIASLTLVYSFF